MAERFLLDENVPSSIIESLRKKRFEVRSVIQAFEQGRAMEGLRNSRTLSFSEAVLSFALAGPP